MKRLDRLKDQLCRGKLTNVLDRFIEIENTLSIENRLTRLAVLSKVLFDEEIDNESQKVILNIAKSKSPNKNIN
jgi:hypothetical protein